MTRFSIHIDFDLPTEDWLPAETQKALERIALMASDQLDRWEGAATVRDVTVYDDSTVRVTA